jgi:hypothetical protein
MSHLISKAQRASLPLNAPANAAVEGPRSSATHTPGWLSAKFLAAFLLGLFVVLSVHLIEFPGSVPDFRRESGGGVLLDVKPSFSAEAIYARLESYGEGGRKNYLIRNLTVDIILPLSLLPFLGLLMGQALTRFPVGKAARLFLLSMPLAYVIFDITENASVVAILANYPERLTFLASVLPYLTVIKRTASMLALFAPVIILLLALRRRHRDKRKALLCKRQTEGSDTV